MKYSIGLFVLLLFSLNSHAQITIVPSKGIFFPTKDYTRLFQRISDSDNLIRYQRNQIYIDSLRNISDSLALYSGLHGWNNCDKYTISQDSLFEAQQHQFTLADNAYSDCSKKLAKRPKFIPTLLTGISIGMLIALFLIK